MLFTGILTLVIIPSNAIVITTWNLTGKRKNISTLLSLMAVSDSCVLLVDYIYKSILYFEVEGNICKFNRIWTCFGTFFHSFSIFLTTYVAYSVLWSVRFPLMVRKTSVICLLILAVCLFLQSFISTLSVKIIWNYNAIFRKRDISRLCYDLSSNSTVWKIPGDRSRSAVI